MNALLLPCLVLGQRIVSTYDATPRAWTSRTTWTHSPSLREERERIDAQAAKTPWNARSETFVPIAQAAYVRFAKSGEPRDALRGLLADDAAGFPVTTAHWNLSPPDLSRIRSDDYELYRARFLVEGRRSGGSVAHHGKAIKALLKADPDDPNVVAIGAFLNATTVGGDRMEGLRLARLYQRLEPTSPNGSYFLGWAWLCLTQTRRLNSAEIEEAQNSFRSFAQMTRKDDWRRGQADRLVKALSNYREEKRS